MVFFANKTLLITGGTGSFGNAVLKRFLTTDIKEIRIFSRDEKKQDDMRHEYQANYPAVAHKIKFYIGDVRNRSTLKYAMQGVDYVFHAAALKQVPSCEFFPMEAGNRCKDECLPEETNRRIVDIISDVNMAYSEHARRYLADTGLPKERTYVTGSPMAEVLHNNLAEIEASDIHKRLGLEKGKYILLSAHREESIDTEKNFLSLFTAINKMAEKYDMPILYSCHPRSRKRLEASGFQLDRRVIQHEPLGFHDYNCLQMNAFAVVSDSGTLPEESSFFTSVGHPFPAVCIRTSTERPEALDKACFFIAGIDSGSLLQAVDTAVAMNAAGDHGIPVPDYVDENVSTKVVKIIQSYTGIVNKMVWRKN